MATENQIQEQTRGSSARSGSEGALVRIGASTVGCAAFGGAIGSLFGPSGVGIGAAVGGVVGLAASATDAIKSKDDT